MYSNNVLFNRFILHDFPNAGWAGSCTETAADTLFIIDNIFKTSAGRLFAGNGILWTNFFAHAAVPAGTA